MSEQFILTRQAGANITTFGWNLKKIRIIEFNNATQEKFSKFLGVTRPSLGSWEDGRAHPRLHELIRICKKLRIHDIGAFILDENFDLKNPHSLKTAAEPSALEERYFALGDKEKVAVNALLGL